MFGEDGDNWGEIDPGKKYFCKGTFSILESEANLLLAIKLAKNSCKNLVKPSETGGSSEPEKMGLGVGGKQVSFDELGNLVRF